MMSHTGWPGRVGQQGEVVELEGPGQLGKQCRAVFIYYIYLLMIYSEKDISFMHNASAKTLFTLSVIK